MKELLNARFFSWLEECSGKDVTKDEVELVVGEFVADLERMCDKVHIPVDTRSAFPVISVQSPVSIQYRWQS